MRKRPLGKLFCPICGRRLIEVAYGHFSIDYKRIVGQMYAHTRKFEDCPIEYVYIDFDRDFNPNDQIPLMVFMDFKNLLITEKRKKHI